MKQRRNLFEAFRQGLSAFLSDPRLWIVAITAYLNLR